MNSRPTPAAAVPEQIAHSTRSSRGALVALALSTLLSALGTSIANVALPTLARAFDADFGQVQWIVLAYLLAITASIVGVGRLGDRVGRRRLLEVGLLVFTVASAVAGLAPSLGVMIVARVAQGLGAAVMMALSLALVAESVPVARTGGAMGLLGSTSAAGTALGPSLGGLLIDGLGWPAIFLVEVPLGLVALALARRSLPADRPAQTGVAFDTAGTLLLAATLAAYALAVTLGRGHLGAVEIALLAAAALGGAVFVRVETRSPAPLVRLSLLRDRGLGVGLATSLLVSTVVMATMIVGPFYLSGALGQGPGTVGLVMSMGPLVAALVGVPAGRVVDRLGTARTVHAGLAAIALGSALLALLPMGLGIPGWILPIAVVTAGYALFQAANNTAVLRGVGSEQRGVVSGMLQLSRNLGLVTGASVMVAVFAFASGSADPTAATPAGVALGMHVAFAVAAAITLVALGLVALRGRSMALGIAGLAIALLTPGLATAAQPVGAEASPSPTVATEDRGVMLRSADGRNSLRLLGLLQLQLAHHWVDAAPDTDAFSIRRARLGLVGSVLREELRYTLVADFADVAPRLVFANVDVTIVPRRLTVRAGQFKRPFSRSFLTPGSELSLVDRPMTVGPGAFGDNADLGVMLHDGGAGRFEYAAGVFNGTGPNVVPDRIHPLLALRVGYNTRGTKPYTEGDLDGGKARFGVAAAALLDLDAHGAHTGSTSAVVDMTFMARGFSLSSAVYARATQDGARWSNQRLGAVGHHTQLGYVIAKRVEPVVRYTVVQGADTAATHDIAGGLNVYLRGHAIKWQTSVSARLGARDGRPTTDLHLSSQLGVAF